MMRFFFERPYVWAVIAVGALAFGGVFGGYGNAQEGFPPAITEVPVDGHQGEPPVSQEEIRNFRNEFQNIQKEAKQLQKQLSGTKEAEQYGASINEVITTAASCLSRINQVPLDDKRDVMNECWNLRPHDTMNEIRDEFVPPQEVKNVLREITNQRKELLRHKKQAAKRSQGGDIVQVIDGLLVQLDQLKTAVESTTGRDKRDAMQEYWDANVWEEVNKVRARVELPREMARALKELKALQRLVSGKSYQNAFAFFGIDWTGLLNVLSEREALIEHVNNLVSQGEAEEAFQLVQENIYNQEGWHPGDLRHLVEMIKEAHRMLKRVRDANIKSQIMTIMESIASTMNEGDYRAARDAMVQFSEYMRRYEQLFRPYYRGGTYKMNDKTRNAIETLESLIQDKLQKSGMQNGEGGESSYSQPGSVPAVPVVPAPVPAAPVAPVPAAPAPAPATVPAG